MSDLVERVARAMWESYPPSELELRITRAAIREVAAWLGEQKQFDGDGKGVVAAHFRKQLEETK